MLALTNISVKRGHRWILSDVDLHVGPGEVLALCGPNGAGKSTLLKVASGEIVPTSGRVELHQRSMASFDSKALAGARAVLPQHCTVPFAFTAEDIVRLGRVPFDDEHHPQTKALIAQALDAVGATHFAAAPFNQLSGGEQQRVQFARVLVQVHAQAQPGVLFLDEPTSSLDPASQHQVLQLAVERARAGLAVVVVVHDVNLASRYASHIHFLREGKTVASGKTREVLTPKTIARVYSVHATAVTCDGFAHPFFILHGAIPPPAHRGATRSAHL